MMHAIAERKTEWIKKDISSVYLELFPKCALYIAKRNGNLEDAKDVFHDALIIFMEREKAAGEEIRDANAYIMTLVRNLWFRKMKGDKTEHGPEDIYLIPDDYFPDKKQLKLLSFLAIAGRKCMDLLRAIYYEENSIQDITAKFDFRNLHSASVQKYKCIQKLRTVIKEKSISYDDFE